MSEWFGELPKHWETHKTSELFVERSEKVSDSDFAPLSVSKNGVVPQIATVAKSNAGDNRKLVRKGDFVINSRSDRRGSSGVSDYDGSVSLINIVLTQRSETNGKFWHYLFRSHSFIDEYYRNGRGIVADLWTTRYTEMKGIYLPFPPRAEQDQIVRYLDWKMSQINKLINAKKKQSALLQEQKRTFINHTLSKSSDTWHNYRAKYLFKERNERSEHGNETHLSMSQKYGLVSDELLDERRMLSESYEGGKICHENDVVLNRLKAHLGVFALARQKGVISPDYTVLQPITTKILPRYAEYYLKSDVCRYELLIRVRGVVEGFWRLYTEDFNTITIPTPALDEQREILCLLDDESKRIEKLVSTLNNEIDLLHEYRTRLISDVVTGKLDVRDAVIPNYETVEETTVVEDDVNDSFEEAGDE